MGKFEEGRQPCDNYKPHMDGNEFATWENVHECYCPFDGSHSCDGEVSSCEHCRQDHHSGGYETCKGCNQNRKEYLTEEKESESAKK